MVFVMSQAPWIYFYLRMTQVSFFSHKVLDSLCLTVNNELVKLTVLSARTARAFVRVK